MDALQDQRSTCPMSPLTASVSILISTLRLQQAVLLYPLCIYAAPAASNRSLPDYLRIAANDEDMN